MKKIKRIRPTLSIQEAAAKLGISDSTVLRLVQRGTLHATKPELVDGHWTRRIFWDKSFLNERARRLHGLKAPRRKHIPDTDSVQREFERKARAERLNEKCEFWSEKDPSPIQTVTDAKKNELTQAAMLERAEDAINTCNLSVTHASEWCDKAQKAYIACAEERRGSLRCAAWCTIACIIAAIILIANIFA